jgi:hypothetical protein
LSYNTNVWKCHKETPHIAIINKQKCPFSKTENRKEEVGTSGRRIYKKRVMEAEFSGNFMYSCMQVEK